MLSIEKNRTGLKLIVLLSFFTAGYSSLSAQKLFTYGNHTVKKDEFLKAYNKNNSDSSNAKIAYKDYFDLYAKFKMKVQAAIDEKMDTSAEQQAELKAFRNQVAESFLREDASMQVLVDEAFERSQKDIHLAHLFIPVAKDATPEQISDAAAKINHVHEQLQKGGSFEQAGAAYNYTDFGYITVFVLPYELENIVYQLKPGHFSAPHQTAKGFHIFRNLEERKAIGKVSVAQILFAFPPEADTATKQRIAARADAAYRQLSAGADFSKLAMQVSDDSHSFPKGGEIPAFGVGVYDPVFEKNAFALETDSALSKPFSTGFGYHILKRMQRILVIVNKENKAWLAALQELVEQSDRMSVAQKALVENIRKKISKNATPQDLASDSAVLEYYKNNLEKYDVHFADQLREFKEGNLLFGIMQKKIWDPASADSLGLMNYYSQHSQQYQWENSADALIVTCLSKTDLEKTQAAIQKNPAAWTAIAEQSNGQVQIDSGRFELSQIPVLERTNFTALLMTAPVTNEHDNSTTFAYILQLHNDKEPKQFDDARGAVINDYQTYLEEQWVEELKKKYPLKLNKRVFNKLP